MFQIDNYIYNVLYNDIESYNTNSKLRYVNQEGDINIPNSFNKPMRKDFRKFSKGFIDGGLVSQTTDNYHASYDFDNKKNIHPFLSFSSMKGDAGINLAKFIHEVIMADSHIFVQVRGLEVYDLREKIFDIERAIIVNTIINADTLKIISKYFPKLKKLEISHCYVENGVSFKDIKGNIDISYSEIENMLCFKDTYADINFKECMIKEIYPVNINSEIIEFDSMGCKHINLELLFLKCNFPNLKKIEVSHETSLNEYSYEKSFTFLPFSAPDLEYFCIDGKVYSLDFLLRQGKLINAYLLSKNDNSGYDFMYPYITNGKERKKKAERNKDAIEIQHKLNPHENINELPDIVELERIKKIANLYYLLSYKEAEKDILYNFGNIIEYIKKLPNSYDVNYFYKAYYDELKYFKKDIYKIYEEKYSIVNNIMYQYYNNIGNNKIILAKSYIYHPTGIPIIIESTKKIPRKIDDIPNPKSYQLAPTYEEIKKEEVKNFFKNFDEKDITASELQFLLDDQSVYNVKSSDIANLGDYGKKIAASFNSYERRQEVYKNIKNKNKKYQILLEKLIESIYNQLTIREKAYILKYVKDYLLESINIYFIISNLDEIIGDEKEILLSLNVKTNGLFSKYKNYLKMTYELPGPNMYENENIPKEYIKRLKLNL